MREMRDRQRKYARTARQGGAVRVCAVRLLGVAVGGTVVQAEVGSVEVLGAGDVGDRLLVVVDRHARRVRGEARAAGEAARRCELKARLQHRNNNQSIRGEPERGLERGAGPGAWGCRGGSVHARST